MPIKTEPTRPQASFAMRRATCMERLNTADLRVRERFLNSQYLLRRGRRRLLTQAEVAGAAAGPCRGRSCCCCWCRWRFRAGARREEISRAIKVAPSLGGLHEDW